MDLLKAQKQTLFALLISAKINFCCGVGSNLVLYFELNVRFKKSNIVEVFPVPAIALITIWEGLEFATAERVLETFFVARLEAFFVVAILNVF